MSALYDTIGVEYTQLRRPDPRIAQRIRAALGTAHTVLNVGAGTGSYEPQDRDVTAVEPSAGMISQRPAGAARVVQAGAEALPFADDSFDAVMGVLTVHHWNDQRHGLAEMRRVTRGPVVILTYDPAARPWPTDYFPELARLDERQMPPMELYGEMLGPVRIEALPIPHDCSDGFLYAFWRRPAAYCEPRLRQGSSSFWKLSGLERGLSGLERDLVSGAWEERYGHLLRLEELDVGYRLVTAGEAQG